MKIMTRLHIFYYLALLVFILFIPKTSTDINFLKLGLFILVLGSFILLCTLFVVISFNKKMIAVKKYYNSNAVLMIVGIITFLTLGHSIYKKTNSLFLLIAIFMVLFIGSNLLNYQILKVSENLEFDLIQETKLFLKMGKVLDQTHLNNAVSKLDYMFFAFAIAVFIAEDIYIFGGVVLVILLLSIKYVKQIMSEFQNSGLISKKEILFSIFSYYFCYLFSIIWSHIFPNLSVLLVGGASILAIKIYTRRIAEKVYEEKNCV